MFTYIFFLIINLLLIFVSFIYLIFSVSDKKIKKSIIGIIFLIGTSFFGYLNILDGINSYKAINIIENEMRIDNVENIQIFKENDCNKNFKKDIIMVMNNKEKIGKIFKMFNKIEIYMDKPYGDGDSFIFEFNLKDKKKLYYRIYFEKKDTHLYPIKLKFNNYNMIYDCNYPHLRSSISVNIKDIISFKNE